MEENQFVDAIGRIWESRVTANVILRLRTETGISLFRVIANAAEKVEAAKLSGDENAKALAEASANRAFADFFSEGPNLASIMFLSVERQAKERRVSKDDLLDALNTQELLTGAIEAVKAGVVNFFRPAASEEEATPDQPAEAAPGA